jgi:hypothetical protein
MRIKPIALVPLILLGIAVPAVAASTFAAAIGPVLVGAVNPVHAGDATPPAMPADPDYHGAPYVGALTAPPAEAMNKDYPLCSATVSDDCRNPDGH